MASFNHVKEDFFYPPDWYHITFDYTRWNATVYGGTPTYLNYWIYDAYNGVTRVYGDYYGYALHQFPSGVYMWLNYTAGYYPGYRARTTLLIRNTTINGCAADPWNCVDYGQVSEFYIQ